MTPSDVNSSSTPSDDLAVLADSNGLVQFGPSRIQGTGGFACRHIPAGTRVIEYVGQQIDKRESMVRCEQGNACIFTINEEWDLDGNVPWNPARFFNHSCSPNCDAEQIEDRIWIVTTRDVASGEELTFNYGYDFEAYREYPCGCGAKECVGFMVAEEFHETLRARASGPA